MGNGRLRNFRGFQKAAKNVRKVSTRGRPAPAGRGQVPATLSRVCTATTCSKCEKIVKKCEKIVKKCEKIAAERNFVQFC